MADTVRTLEALRALIPDNMFRGVSPQDMRDLLVSVMGGFGAYQDLLTKTTPITTTGGVRELITCDSAGDFGDTDFLPYPKVKVTDELWDDTNNRILLANLPRGARVVVTVDIVVDPSSPNTTIDLFAEFYNSSDVKQFERGYSLAEIKSASPHNENINVRFFIGSLITDGYVYFNLLTNNICDVQVGGFYIEVTR